MSTKAVVRMKQFNLLFALTIMQNINQGIMINWFIMEIFIFLYDHVQQSNCGLLVVLLQISKPTIKNHEYDNSQNVLLYV